MASFHCDCPWPNYVSRQKINPLFCQSSVSQTTISLEIAGQIRLDSCELCFSFSISLRDWLIMNTHKSSLAASQLLLIIIIIDYWLLIRLLYNHLKYCGAEIGFLMVLLIGKTGNTRSVLGRSWINKERAAGSMVSAPAALLWLGPVVPAQREGSQLLLARPDTDLHHESQRLVSTDFSSHWTSQQLARLTATMAAKTKQTSLFPTTTSCQ